MDKGWVFNGSSLTAFFWMVWYALSGFASSIYQLFCFGNTPSSWFRAYTFWVHLAKSAALLGCNSGGNCWQHPWRHVRLVAWPHCPKKHEIRWRAKRFSPQGLAGGLGPQDFAPLMVARFWWSLMSCGWMVEARMAAMSDLYVFWQACPLPHANLVIDSGAR